MNIREAIYKADHGGQIRLGEKVFDVPKNIQASLALSDKEDGYVFTVAELTSLDWEAKSNEWLKHTDV